jgi:hypothetical protein
MKKRLNLLVMLVCLLALGLGLIGCDNGSTNPDGGINKVATPTASPDSGAVSSGTTVTLSSSTSGATIYYTTDGSTPTTSSTVYSTPISITSAVTIKAIAIKSGMTDSDVLTASYTISSGGDSSTLSGTIWKGSITDTSDGTIINATLEFTSEGYSLTLVITIPLWGTPTVSQIGTYQLSGSTITLTESTDTGGDIVTEPGNLSADKTTISMEVGAYIQGEGGSDTFIFKKQ